MKMLRDIFIWVKRIARSIEGTAYRLKHAKTDESLFSKFIPCSAFFFDITNKRFYIRNLKRSGIRNKIISSASAILEHRFDLLGSGDVNLGDKIRWNYDFKNNYHWPNKYFKCIPIINNKVKCDIKVPWELSRFQHLACLGQAYWINYDLRCYNEFKAEVLDWIQDNPVGMSVNWVCAMETAIRAVSWIIAYHYFQELIKGDEGFRFEFLKSIYEAGIFIFKNLEIKNGIRNNHYLCGVAGLLWIGLFFKGLGQNEDKWLDTGYNGLLSEMEYQVYEEGTSFESSIAYHRFSTEVFLSSTILAERNGLEFPDWYKQRLKGMCRFVKDYTKPNGLAPQIGDSDDGRFHIFSNYGSEEKRDHRHIIAVAGEYFDDDELRCDAGDETADALWLADKPLKDKQAELEQGRCIEKSGDEGALRQPETRREYEFLPYPKMGCYIFKDPVVYLLVRCGVPDARSGGGHAHNDILSYELNIRGQDFIIDPGTYVYTEDSGERNLFRSTAKHNTLMLCNEEQNIFIGGELFKLSDRTGARTDEFGVKNDGSDSGSVLYLEGCHRGYRESLGCTHTRRFEYNLKNHILRIEDILDNPSEASVLLHFDDTIKIVPINNRKVIVENLAEISFNSPYRIEETCISKRYGEKTNSYVICIKGKYSIITEVSIIGEAQKS